MDERGITEVYIPPKVVAKKGKYRAFLLRELVVRRAAQGTATVLTMCFAYIIFNN